MSAFLTIGIVGLAVGALLGLTGSGGLMAAPALVLLLDMPIHEARPIALVAVGTAAFIGTIEGVAHRRISLKAVLVMSLAGMVISPVGIAMANAIPDRAVEIVFSAILLWFAWSHFRQHQAGGGRAAEHTKPGCVLSDVSGEIVWTTRCVFTVTAIGAAAGLLTAIMGIGGGFLIAPAIARVTRLDASRVVATSLGVICIVSATTVAHELHQGFAFSSEAITFIGATLLGLVAARLLVERARDTAIKRLFALSALIAGVAIAYP